LLLHHAHFSSLSNGKVVLSDADKVPLTIFFSLETKVLHLMLDSKILFRDYTIGFLYNGSSQPCGSLAADR
jgi:hypothetical protein